MGVGDLLTRLATCCKPVPGDEIIGYVTRGKGSRFIVPIARMSSRSRSRSGSCPSRGAIRTRRRTPLACGLEAWDRVGLMRDVSSVAADEKINLL